MSTVDASSGVSSSVPSSSTWQWQAEYGLFFNPQRNLWAQYDQQTGEYTYLPSDTYQQTAQDAHLPKEDGELSDGEAESALPARAHPDPSSSSATSRPSVDYDDPALYAFPSAPHSLKAQTTTAASNSHSTLRLLVIRSACLPPTQTLAQLSSLQPDGYTIGRDKQLSPEDGRIRLREMEVSKSHAVVYHTEPEPGEGNYVDRDGDGVNDEAVREWDRGKIRQATVKWWVVDSGSVHGTFVGKAKDRKAVDDGAGGLSYDEGPDSPVKEDKKKKRTEDKGKRLSESKTASLPVQLEHGDLLTVGSSVFEVHLHSKDLPCTRCTLPTLPNNLIPTSLPPASATPSSPPADASSASGGWDAILTREHGPVRPLLNPKEKLKQLKAEMLARPSPSSLTAANTSIAATAPSSIAYHDRAALRRSQFPDEPLPPLQQHHHHHAKKRKTTTATILAGPALPLAPAPKPVISAAPTTYAALPTTNKGHSLLLKHGWTPGTGLGSGEGRTEPVEVKRAAGEGRKGLGTVPATPARSPSEQEPEGSWRDQGREKRWREMNLR